jgi:DNA-binding response OmpR family regulator
VTLKLLIADDARDVAEVIAFGARMAWPGCRVTIAESGAEALDLFREVAADLVVLDVGMAPPNGFEVCRRIRAVSQVPILMLTAHDTTLDKVRALDLGADDYMTKPFDHLELFARLRAMLRRPTSNPAATAPDFVCAELSIVYATQEVRLNGSVVRLTAIEYRLLEELVRHAGSALPHQVLLERVWGPAYVDDVHYLKVFIRRLRRKLGDAADQPRFIHTEWGIGYRFSGPH